MTRQRVTSYLAFGRSDFLRHWSLVLRHFDIGGDNSTKAFTFLSMVRVDVEYTGDLHCDATHGPSRSKLSTDAPAGNKGKGAAFSPTDLVGTALGTCISTTMGIKAEELGVNLRGMKVSVQKEMSKDPPRRIVALPSE